MAKSYSIIKFFFNHPQFTLRDRKKIKEFIEQIFKVEKKKIGSVTYVFSTDKHLQALNKRYLNHNYKTDILTFPIVEDGLIQAEIYISIERVKKNAKLFNTTFKDELFRVIFHGALHLCGYKDKSQRQKSVMRQMEDHYLTLYKSFT
jgi:rRNA maturation RNase YbeY